MNKLRNLQNWHWTTFMFCFRLFCVSWALHLPTLFNYSFFVAFVIIRMYYCVSVCVWALNKYNVLSAHLQWAKRLLRTIKISPENCREQKQAEIIICSLHLFFSRNCIESVWTWIALAFVNLHLMFVECRYFHAPLLSNKITEILWGGNWEKLV